MLEFTCLKKAESNVASALSENWGKNTSVISSTTYKQRKGSLVPISDSVPIRTGILAELRLPYK